MRIAEPGHEDATATLNLKDVVGLIASDGRGRDGDHPSAFEQNVSVVQSPLRDTIEHTDIAKDDPAG
ncbi:hypothetical protein GCM10009796_23120 [Microbacterium koreense]